MHAYIDTVHTSTYLLTAADCFPRCQGQAESLGRCSTQLFRWDHNGNSERWKPRRRTSIDVTRINYKVNARRQPCEKRSSRCVLTQENLSMEKLCTNISLHAAKARALVVREFKEMGVYVYAYARCCVTLQVLGVKARSCRLCLTQPRVQGSDKMFLFCKRKTCQKLADSFHSESITDCKQPSLNQQTSAQPGMDSASGQTEPPSVSRTYRIGTIPVLKKQPLIVVEGDN